MSNFLHTQKYKSEVIMEQYFDGQTLFIITKSEGKWTLYNHTESKKIATSKDYMTVHDKIPN